MGRYYLKPDIHWSPIWNAHIVGVEQRYSTVVHGEAYDIPTDLEVPFRGFIESSDGGPFTVRYHVSEREDGSQPGLFRRLENEYFSTVAEALERFMQVYDSGRDNLVAANRFA